MYIILWTTLVFCLTRSCCTMVGRLLVCNNIWIKSNKMYCAKRQKKSVNGLVDRSAGRLVSQPVDWLTSYPSWLFSLSVRQSVGCWLISRLGGQNGLMRTKTFIQSNQGNSKALDPNFPFPLFPFSPFSFPLSPFSSFFPFLPSFFLLSFFSSFLLLLLFPSLPFPFICQMLP